MDANILHIHPKGREVSLDFDKEKNIANFRFPLLNKDDFFIVKFLINGAPVKSDYEFSITADDLPPNLTIQRLSYRQISVDNKKERKEHKFEKSEFLVGIVLVLIAVAITMLSYFSKYSVMPQINIKIFSWLNVFSILYIASLIGYIVAVILAIAGVALMVGAFIGNFEFPRRKKFVLPKELTSTALGLEFLLDEDRYKTASKAIDNSLD